MIRFRPASLLVALLLVAGCTATEARQNPTPSDGPQTVPQAVEAAAIGAVPNLSRAGDLYLAGQPSPEDFGTLREAGITEVVTLRHSGELDGFDEEAAVRALGLGFTTLPWNGPDELTDAVFDSTRAVLRAMDGPTLLHCGSANRVGAVWLPFRVLDQGVDLEQAVEEARRVGLRTAAYETLARDYIARHR